MASPGSINITGITFPPKTPTHTYIPSPITPPNQNQTLTKPQIDFPHDENNTNLLSTLNGKDLQVIASDGKQSSSQEILEKEKMGSWSSLLKTKPPSAGSQELAYHTPIFKNGVLQIGDEIVEQGAKEWENTVVGYFIDKKLPFSLVKTTVQKKWNLQGQLDIMLDDGLFYFNFTNHEDRLYSLDVGSFYILGKLFIVSPWTTDIEIERSNIARIPIWVNFFKVPKFLWNPEGLGVLASSIGRPMFFDRNTEANKFLTFARVCIEIDASKELPYTIPVEASGKSFDVKIEYSWKPFICTKCTQFGHYTEKCGQDKTKDDTSGKSKPQEQEWTSIITKQRRNQTPAAKIQGKKSANEGSSMLKRNNTTKDQNFTQDENRFGAFQALSELEFSFQTGGIAQNKEDNDKGDALEEGECENISNCSRVQETPNQQDDIQLVKELKEKAKKTKKTRTQIESDCPPGFESHTKQQQQHSIKMSNVASTLIEGDSGMNHENLVKYVVVPLAKDLGMTGMSTEGQEKLFKELLDSNSRNPG